MALPKRQNPLDWTTQAWNIALGRKVEPDVDSWLMGPIGKVNEQADAFINRLAEQHGLSIVYDGPGSGLAESVESWGVPIPPKTASFYTQTSSYAFEVKTLWRPGFASLGAWVAKLFSRRIQQLNLPGDSLDKSIVFKSEIIQLIDAQGKVHFTIWRRSNQVTGETIFFGIYTTCRTPSGQICIKAIFPLPCGSATVLFGIEKDTQGNLLLR
ncbi:MAG: hypothetical protein MK080_04915 [Opitutales bacterium]|nr:hypothetical protein [Opitutales bacterium]NRA27760.1 hypothetical protein [Opitutales bacterium]